MLNVLKVAWLTLLSVSAVNTPLLAQNAWPPLVRYADLAQKVLDHYAVHPPPGNRKISLSNLPSTIDIRSGELSKPQLEPVLNPIIVGPFTFDQLRSFAPLYGYVLTYAQLPPFAYTSREKCEIARLEQLFVSNRRGIREKTEAFVSYQRYRADYSRALSAVIHDRSPIPSHITAVLDSHFEFSTRGKKLLMERSLARLDELWHRDPHIRWADYRERFFQEQQTGRLVTTIPSVIGSWATIVDSPGVTVQVAEVELQRNWFSLAALLEEQWSWSSGAPRGPSYKLSVGAGMRADLPAIAMSLIIARVLAPGLSAEDAPIHPIGYEYMELPRLPGLQAGAASRRYE
jgi:hypothetical protein